MISDQPKTVRQRRPLRRVALARSATRVTHPVVAPDETLMVGLCDWEAYLRLDEALTKRGHRIRYFEGVVEVASFSRTHNVLSRHLCMLTGAFCDFVGTDYQAWGSTTQRLEGTAAGEPDESFSFGLEPKDKPDLVIEVALSSGGIDKLEFWAALGAKEVWIWQNDRLHGFARAADDTFQPITTSTLLPGLSLALVQEFAVVEPSSRAIRAFREKLQAAAA